MVAATNIQIGKRIRALRRKKSLSQEQLAERINMSSKYLGEIERGKVNFSIDIAEKIASGLEIDLSRLFDFHDEPDRNALLEKIDGMIKEASDSDLQTIFRFLKSIL